VSFGNGSLGSGGITFSGGTLQWNGSNTQDISGRILAIATGKTAILDTNGNAVNFGNGLSGLGGVTKSGAGTLTLNSASSYTGATTISAGTLQFGNALAAQNSIVSIGATNG